MESYIVRIYRRTKDGPQDIAGIVEEVQTQMTKPFKSSGELLKILVGMEGEEKNRSDKHHKEKGGDKNAIE